MEKHEVAIAAAAVTIVVMASTLRARKRRIKQLETRLRKWESWGSIATRFIRAAEEQAPDGVLMPEKLANDIEFFNLMNENNLT